MIINSYLKSRKLIGDIWYDNFIILEYIYIHIYHFSLIFFSILSAYFFFNYSNFRKTDNSSGIDGLGFA